MKTRLLSASVEGIEEQIHTVRGQRIMLDADLGRIYGVTTKALNQAVRRNADRFPEDFVFRLTSEEFAAIWRQTITDSNRSQIVTGSQKHRDPRYLPWAFTEHGAGMLH